MTAHAPSLGPAYDERRGRLETYFDRTARDAWAQLTSDAPVSRIRATVRAGRDRMRETLLSWLPESLDGVRVRDAGCGTGALSAAAMLRGAAVTAVDVSASLVDLARERTPPQGRGSIDYRVGDMVDPRLGPTDYAVAMDSLIHYPVEDIVRALSALAGSTSTAILFTFAPRTPALTVMHAVGKLFPRADRAPAIEPVGEQRIRAAIAAAPAFAGWRVGRDLRVSSGFYKSHALELIRT